ncbi:MAG: iron ABC transporter permease [Syntrophales bacterium]|nr:iron ABC transporter permease [Syntrophales bacterium]
MGYPSDKALHPPVTLPRILKISLVLFLVLVIVSIFSLSTGVARISLLSVLRGLMALPGETIQGITPPEEVIVLSIRLPRVLLATLVGAALSVAGVVFQALLRNPLADPYIMGVSAGAALGAMTGILLSSVTRWFSIPVLAFAGGLFSVGIVFGIAGYKKRLETNTLLLTGVMVNAFFSAVILFVLSISDQFQLQRAIFWMMGDLSGAQAKTIIINFVLLLIGVSFIYSQGRNLNLLVTGEETAAQLGVSVEKTKIALLIAASLITAGAVSASGPIGFVGLIIPHILRVICGPDHRILVPAAFLLGSTFLVAADTLARCLIAPTELPVGVITALCGAPYFLCLLRRRLMKEEV